jgi:hypothetical protein
MTDNSRATYAEQTAGLDAAVPGAGCLGAIVLESDPTYYLYGSHLQRHIIYLEYGNPVTQASNTGLAKVLVTTSMAYDVNQFQLDGWKIRPIGGGWDLATRKIPRGSPVCKP